MVTEVWAEPQLGRLTDLNSELKYLEGLQYNEVPNAVSFLYGLAYIICTDLLQSAKKTDLGLNPL